MDQRGNGEKENTRRDESREEERTEQRKHRLWWTKLVRLNARWYFCEDEFTICRVTVQRGTVKYLEVRNVRKHRWRMQGNDMYDEWAYVSKRWKLDEKHSEYGELAKLEATMAEEHEIPGGKEYLEIQVRYAREWLFWWVRIDNQKMNIKCRPYNPSMWRGSVEIPKEGY